MRPPINDPQDPPIIQHQHFIPNPPKPPIQCLHSAKSAESIARAQPALLFTHGAGGTLHTPTVANFINGFISTAARKTVFAFQGNMNLNSRVDMFNAIIDHSPIRTKEGNSVEVGATCLGGRSMGARAAVMAARQETRSLVLVSYPLHTDKDVRDGILLAIPDHVKVIFVTGDRDGMCDLARLDDVRRKMKCPTWRVVVRGADHGMNAKPKGTTREMQREIGRVVADWIGDGGAELDKREGRIFWDGERGVKWSGWADGEGDWRGDGRGQVGCAQLSLGGDEERFKESRRGRKHATKAKQVQSKRGRKSAKGSQPAKKRKFQDEDTSMNGTQPVKKRKRTR